MVDYWSQSRVNMIAKCPRQFYYRYILGLKIPPTAALSFGTTYHTTIESNFKYKLEVGSDMSKDMVKSIFSDEWGRNSLEVDWELEDRDFGKGWHNDRGTMLVGSYIDEVAPSRMPLTVEQSVEVRLNGIDKPLIGTIDLIGVGGYILEHKTAKKRWSQSRVDNSLQVSAYYLLYELTFGKIPTKFIYDVAIKHGNPKKRIQTLTTQRSRGQLNDFVGRLVSAQDLVSKETYPKTSPENWYCSPRWCGYYHNCMGNTPIGQLRLVEAKDDLANAI